MKEVLYFEVYRGNGVSLFLELLPTKEKETQDEWQHICTAFHGIREYRHEMLRYKKGIIPGDISSFPSVQVAVKVEWEGSVRYVKFMSGEKHFRAELEKFLNSIRKNLEVNQVYEGFKFFVSWIIGMEQNML